MPLSNSNANSSAPLKNNYNVLEISSAQNPRYKNWLKLLESKGIKKNAEALISGRKVLHEILSQFPERVSGVLVRNLDEVLDLQIPEHTTVYLLSAELFAQLDIYGVKAPLLVISAPPLPIWNEELATGLTIFLPFQNPINLGTTIRSAAALNAQVVLLKEAATPYLPKSLRAAGPAIFQVQLWEGPSIEELANYSHLPLFALSPKGQNIFKFDFLETMGLVVGMEGPGLDAYWPETKRLSIPMQPEVESLNAAIAIGMAMACRLASLSH